ncbi:MAG: AraC family transcriptional regulator [Cryomorphaceae bacterium]|nr:MAG: AraC family transcriptional regulator [Cryomorphaceae bacterium]
MSGLKQGLDDPLLFFPQTEPLSDMVQLIWQIDRFNPYCQEVIVPMGVVEVIFNFGVEQAFKASLYNKEFVLPQCFVQGYHHAPIKLYLPENQSLFGVVFHASSVYHLFGVPAGEFAASCIDLALVNASISELWYRLAEEASFQKRIDIVAQWLLPASPRLSKREKAFGEILSLASLAELSVAGLSDTLCYSPRHLTRKFRELTGMNSEQTLLYLKYLKARRLMHGSNLSLSQIAHSAGFFDQPHFIRTFKQFTRLTPGEYRKLMGPIEGHYFQNVR